MDEIVWFTLFEIKMEPEVYENPAK